MDSGISIIICSYNGLTRLAATLSSIATLRLPAGASLEILLVDNASTDGTAAYCQVWAMDHQLDHFRVLHEPKSGLSHARWCGILNAKYSYLLFCDDDNHLYSDYLEIGFLILEREQNIGAVGGCGFPIFEVDKPDWFDEFSHSYAVGAQASQSGLIDQGGYLYGAGCFFRRSALLELHTRGFVSILSDRKGSMLSSGGDVELCLAIQLLGYRLWYSDDLKFGHYIEARRLEWSYYLRLKEGIAASFPLLEAYQFARFNSMVSFRRHLYKLFVLAIKGWARTFFYANSLRMEVAHKICSAKIFSFIKNYKPTLIAMTELRGRFS